MHAFNHALCKQRTLRPHQNAGNYNDMPRNYEMRVYNLVVPLSEGSLHARLTLSKCRRHVGVGLFPCQSMRRRICRDTHKKAVPIACMNSPHSQLCNHAA